MAPRRGKTPHAGVFAPEPPWLRPPRPRARNQLTREAIVGAALRVIDEAGLDGLTMRSVADELGTGAASLYWHIRNREELLNLMIDAIAADIVLPDPDPSRWQEQLKELARNMRDTMLRHKDIAKATMGRIPLGPNTMRVSEWTLGLLRAAKISDRTAALAMDLFALYVGAHAVEMSGEMASPTGEETSFQDLIEMYRGYFRSLPVEAFPHTVALADLLVEGSPEERFEFGLDVLIDGLAAVGKSRRKT